MEKITDAKRSFAFTLQLKGVPEPLYFGTEDGNVMNEWIAKFENASTAKGEVDICIKVFYMYLSIATYMYMYTVEPLLTDTYCDHPTVLYNRQGFHPK